MSNNEPDYKDNLIFVNTTQANELDDNSTQANLTEQWKKGELPEGLYYVENNEGNIGILGWSKFAGWYNIKQVFAPVPTFNELQNMNKAVNECMAANIKLVEENKQIKKLMKKLYKQSDVSYCEEILLNKINEVLK